MKIDEELIGAIFSESSDSEVSEFVTTFNEYNDVFGFSSEFHVFAFLAQLRVEVGTDLKPKRENMNYTPKALRAIFKKYRNEPDASKRDGRTSSHRANQQNIANMAYGGRLGNDSHNDGWTFRGYGYIQLTGRYNFTQTAKVINSFLGDNLTADTIANEDNVKYSLLTALAFYHLNDLKSAKNIDEVTAKVNKHTDSYGKRKYHYQRIASL